MDQLKLPLDSRAPADGRCDSEASHRTVAGGIALTDLPAFVDACTNNRLSPASRGWLLTTTSRFARYAWSHGRILNLADVSPELAASFVMAPGRDGGRPATSTSHQRRAALRLVFTLAAALNPSLGDPTRSVALPPRSLGSIRPLTDLEVEIVREASLHTLTETRLPSIVALAEAGAVTTEIAAVRVEDVDVETGTVALSGCRSAAPRSARLSRWGLTQVTRRMLSVGTVPCQSIAYQGDGCGNAPQASISVAMRRLFNHAGLLGEPDVRLGSLRAWAGRSVFDRTGRVEDAALVMGSRSLDVAARTIAWDWQGSE